MINFDLSTLLSLFLLFFNSVFLSEEFKVDRDLEQSHIKLIEVIRSNILKQKYIH